jgi:hypothetical protein
MNYFQGSAAALTAPLTSAYLLPTSSIPGSSGGGGDGGCCCPSSTKFLDTLTDKLIAMATALQTRIAELESRPPPGQQRGVIFANVDVSERVGVKFEYIIYLQRYGPPIAGIFDPIYLDLIRAELAAGTITP